MSQPSVRVTNCISTARTVTSAIDKQGPRVAAAIGQIGAELDEQRCLGLIAVLSTLLKRKTNELKGSELACANETTDDDAPRLARDTAVDRGIAIAISSRAALVAGLGDAAAGKYGLAGATPRDSAQLLAVLNTSAGLLERNPPKGRDAFDRETDTEVVCKVIAGVAAELSTAIGSVADEARELQMTLVDRDRELIEWQVAYVCAGGVIEGLFRLAGEERLADYLRPTARKTSGDDVGPVDAPPAGGGGAAGA